jgi:hypothetical protein
MTIMYFLMVQLDVTGIEDGFVNSRFLVLIVVLPTKDIGLNLVPLILVPLIFQPQNCTANEKMLQS